jgi:alpha-N-acetylglucosamine transferase
MIKIDIYDFISRLSGNHAKNKSQKKYAFVWLFYPNHINTNKCNDYIYGCLINQKIISTQLIYMNLSDLFDTAIITPKFIDSHLNDMIEKVFDVHVTYENSIHMDFVSESEKYWSEDEKRWNGVLNKLFIFHPDLFGCYDKIMFLDADTIIKKPHEFIKLFESTCTPAGVYEYSCRCPTNQKITHLVHQKFKDNQIIPKKFCVAGTKFYHSINASLLLVKANEKDYTKICQEINKNTFYKNYPQFKNHILYFPEQEYLTNFYAGLWHSIPHKFLLTAESEMHLPGKFWESTIFDRRIGIPSEFCHYFVKDSSYLPVQNN